MLAYRSTPHSATGCTPFSLMFGREMRTLLPQVDYCAENPVVARDTDMEYKVKMKEYADKNAVESIIRQGDIVVLRNERAGKLEPNFNPEKYTVVSRNSSDMVCKAVRTGNIARHQVQFAKKLFDIPFRIEVEVITVPPKEVEESEPDISVSVPQPQEEQTTGDSATMTTTSTSTGKRRSGRVRRPPIKLMITLLSIEDIDRTMLLFDAFI